MVKQGKYRIHSEPTSAITPEMKIGSVSRLNLKNSLQLVHINARILSQEQNIYKAKNEVNIFSHVKLFLQFLFQKVLVKNSAALLERVMLIR
jgi:hypothetical protein